jgi:tetratricopeptide (TPR) repeat protein
MKSGQLDSAQAAYDRALELDPQATTPRIGAARLLMLRDEGEAAREALRELEGEADTEAQRREAQIHRAVSHLLDGQRDEALAALEEARASAERSQDPEALADILNLLGQVHLETGEPDLALARFTESMEAIQQSDLEEKQKEAAQRDFIFHEARVAIAKQDQAAAWGKASELRSTVRRKWVEGVEDQFNELRGRISMGAGQHEMALQALEHANQHDPRILYLTALALQEVGRNMEAKRACQRVVDFNDPDFAWAFVKDDAARLLDEL